MPLPTRRAVSAAPFAAALAGPATARSPAAERIGGAAREALSGKASGAVLVARGGRVQWAGSVGLAPGGTAAPDPDPDAAFDVLSIGKTFTALAVLRLLDAGMVDLNKPVKQYLPELGEGVADIKVRQALNNDTGLPDYLEGGDDFTPRTGAQALAEISALKPSRKGGTGYHYSNVNFQLLGLMVERITRQPLQAAIRRLVFEPAGLRSTAFFSDPLFRTKPVATGYVDGKPMGSPATWPSNWSLLGAAGIGSTTADLYRLNRAFLAGRVLSPAARARLLLAGAPTYGRGPYVGPDNLDISYGAGLYHWLDRHGRHVHFHGGDGDFGFNAVMLWREEDDLFVTVLMNSRVSKAPVDRGDLMSALLTAAG